MGERLPNYAGSGRKVVAVVELEALDARMLELPPVVEMLKQAMRFQKLIASGSVADLITERKLRRLTQLPKEQQLEAASNILPGFAEK